MKWDKMKIVDEAIAYVKKIFEDDYSGHDFFHTFRVYKMATRIALAGNPNCGKTTLFNSLTGSNQYVVNWTGVTVEKKE